MTLLREWTWRQWMPLRDTDPDPGLFGPESMAWEVMSWPSAALGVFSAATIMLAHPLVAEGAQRHSSVMRDPFGRLVRTVLWVVEVVYGTTVEAHTACERINRIHSGLRGPLPPESATAHVPAGETYDATAQELHRGLYAALMVTLIHTHEAFVALLTTEQRNRLVREWRAIPPLTGVPTEDLWRSYAEVRAWLDEQIAHGRIYPGDGSRRVVGVIRHPPGTSWWARLPWAMWMFLTAGLMPSSLREGYRMPWSRLHAAGFAATAWLMRHVMSPLIRRLVSVPPYVWATERVYDSRFTMR